MYKKIAFITATMLFVATPAVLAQTASPGTKATVDVPVQVKPKREAAPKLKACAAEWQTAKSNDDVRKAGWITFWSACAKRRAAEFPSKAKRGGSAS